MPTLATYCRCVWWKQQPEEMGLHDVVVLRGVDPSHDGYRSKLRASHGSLGETGRAVCVCGPKSVRNVALRARSSQWLNCFGFSTDVGNILVFRELHDFKIEQNCNCVGTNPLKNPLNYTLKTDHTYGSSMALSVTIHLFTFWKFVLFKNINKKLTRVI